MGEKDPYQFGIVLIEPLEMSTKVRARIKQPGFPIIDHSDARREVPGSVSTTGETAAGLGMAAVLGDSEHDGLRTHWKSLTNRPLVILGRNQVDLGGITRPLSATAATWSMRVG